jgi:hypothetical protein
MDIRQIQALHAQYSPHSVVIDIAGHTAAMPALAAPERGPHRKWDLKALPGAFRKAARPALLFVGIAALAGGGGMSAAKIWRVMHESGAAAQMRPVERATVPATTPGASESAINAAPARPLTAADFGQQPATSSALASVDPRSLAISAQSVAPVAHEAEHTTNSTLAEAAASSIHAQHGALAQAVANPNSMPSAPEGAPATPVPAITRSTVRPIARATAATPEQQPAASEPVPVTGHPASAAEASTAKPVLRPLRHLTSHHKTATPGDEQAVVPQPAPAAAASKGGEVQLF